MYAVIPPLASITINKIKKLTDWCWWIRWRVLGQIDWTCSLAHKSWSWAISWTFTHEFSSITWTVWFLVDLTWRILRTLAYSSCVIALIIHSRLINWWGTCVSWRLGNTCIWNLIDRRLTNRTSVAWRRSIDILWRGIEVSWRLETITSRTESHIHDRPWSHCTSVAHSSPIDWGLASSHDIVDHPLRIWLQRSSCIVLISWR